MTLTNDNKPVTFLFGLSGSGKTTLARFMEQQFTYLYIEQDVSSRRNENLWEQLVKYWRNLLHNQSPGELVQQIRDLVEEHGKEGAVVVFDSMQSPYVHEFERMQGTGIVPVIIHASPAGRNSDQVAVWTEC